MIEVGLWVVALIFICFAHYKTQKGLAERLYQRHVVMDKQHKALRREAQRVLREAQKALERAEKHHQDAKTRERKVRLMKEHDGR